MKQSIVAPVVVMFFGVAAAMACQAAPPVPDVQASYTTTAENWATHYFSYFSKQGLKLNFELSPPEIWLFSPAGMMVSDITVDNDPDLKKLASQFPESLGASPLEQRPSSMQAREFLADALSDNSVPSPDKDAWYAVLILYSGEGCDHCSTYDDSLREIQRRNPGKLEVVRVTIAPPES